MATTEQLSDECHQDSFSSMLIKLYLYMYVCMNVRLRLCGLLRASLLLLLIILQLSNESPVDVTDEF